MAQLKSDIKTYLGNWMTSYGVTRITFCHSSDVPAGLTSIDATTIFNSGNGYAGYNSTDIYIYSPDGEDIYPPTSCFDYFYHLTAMTYLNLSNFNTSNVTDMGSMFSNCSGLTSLDLSNFNTGNVTDMGYMFIGCPGLTSLDVSSFNTSNVTNMNNMFDNCLGLTSLDVSSFNTNNVTDMYKMFWGCLGLTSLDVSNFNTNNVTNMGCMFDNCIGLTSLDVSNFNTSNVTNMSSMFWGCYGLTSLDLSNFDTSNVTNMYNMFYNCSNLEHIYVTESWYPTKTTKVTSSSGMFSGCTKLPNYPSWKADVTMAKLASEGGYMGEGTPPTPTHGKVYYGNTEKAVYFGNTRVYYK